MFYGHANKAQVLLLLLLFSYIIFFSRYVKTKHKYMYHSSSRTFFENGCIYIPGFLKTESLILPRAPGGNAAIGSDSTLG